MLIGSKKFTEGWNSWRVAAMGLMNVGRTEGTQIIQLFGRGVRLKGYDLCLKRSARVPLPEAEDTKLPQHIELLETLSIFGIRADYMAQFRDFLQEEGLPGNEKKYEFVLPVIRNLGKQRLKTIRLKKEINGISTISGDAFRKLGPIPTLGLPTEYLQKNRVVLNWYPKVQALRSAGVRGTDEAERSNEAHFSSQHVALLDLDALFFELERFKTERSWHNLNLRRHPIAELLCDHSWYQLLIPKEELSFDSFRKVRLWQEIATALLKKYTERYYTYRKKEWELPHLEYQDLADDDPNLLTSDGGYRVLIEASQEEIVAKLTELRDEIKRGDFRELEFRGLKAIRFEHHIFHPLLCSKNGHVEIRPAPLNEGECRFIEDLKVYHDAHRTFFEDKEFYLLRNLSKGRGVGFFEAGNFHPDFILWLVQGKRQNVAFVDPKGIHNLGPTDPKIMFHKTIKEIEKRLGDPNTVLESFIVAITPANEMEQLWNMNKTDMNARHILFQKDDADMYVGQLLRSLWENT